MVKNVKFKKIAVRARNSKFLYGKFKSAKKTEFKSNRPPGNEK